MGWIAITKDGEELREETHGRPVAAGEEGNLLLIAQEDYGHKVAIDLTQGLVFIDYDFLTVENGYLEVTGAKLSFFITDETNIVGHIGLESHTEPDAEGWYGISYYRPLWRPIWFTRYTNGEPTKVIGAQTTLEGEQYNGRNIKKMICLFTNGFIGIN